MCVPPKKEDTGGYSPWDWMLLSKKAPGLGDFSPSKYHFFCFLAAGEQRTLIQFHPPPPPSYIFGVSWSLVPLRYFNKGKAKPKEKKRAFLPRPLKSDGSNLPGIVPIVSPISVLAKPNLCCTVQKKKTHPKNTKPPNFLLYPLRLVKLPRLKEQIIGNIKHFPLPLALMTGSYQIQRDACRRGERDGWQRDGVSEKGAGGEVLLWRGFVSHPERGGKTSSKLRAEICFLGKTTRMREVFLGNTELRLLRVFYSHKVTLLPPKPAQWHFLVLERRGHGPAGDGMEEL